MDWDSFRFVPKTTVPTTGSPVIDTRVRQRVFRGYQQDDGTLKLRVSRHALDKRQDGFMDGAERRDKAWNLSDEQAQALFQSSCAYCGKASVCQDINGIDRVDNDQDYAPSNCVSCCRQCNAFKARYNVEQWIHHSLMIAAHAVRHGIQLPDGRRIHCDWDTKVTRVQIP